jgi:hypothetical protein
LGQVVVKLARLREPPLHFVAGTDAIGFIKGALERRRGEVDAFLSLSGTTDGDF